MKSARSPGVWAAALLMLAACGGGGQEQVTNDTTPPPPNSPPEIGGSPATSVMQDTAYSFTPTASDADGDTLAFSVANKPSWAVFDAGSGELAGTPGSADLGTTTAVTISVSDGASSVSLPSFDLEVRQPQPGSATVFWDAPSVNADGSALTDLAGFRVYYGAASGVYTEAIDVDDAAATSLLIENLTPGSYFFAVRAVDLDGNESELSSEVGKVVDP